MSNLFIIGNGFDLDHKLKTNYHNFRDFLVQVEKEGCAESGEVSISEDCNLLEDDKIKYHFDNIIIPAMENKSSELANLIHVEDNSAGLTVLEQMDEIEQFFDDANKIVQWVKHGSGQYYTRENNESQAIKRFIAMLEPETGMISHDTNLNTSILIQVLESEFGDTAVKFFQNDIDTDTEPFWLTLRLFIKMTDAVAGEDWRDFEASMGSYDFKMFLYLFKEFETNKYETFVENYLSLLPYNVDMLFKLWVQFTEITFEQQVVSNSINEIFSVSRPKIKRTQNGLELSFTMKDVPLKGNLDYIHTQATFDRHPMSKKQLLQIFNRARSNYFFTFNYTRTLERIYGIPESNICHIHGVLNSAKNLRDTTSGDLIFGHGREIFDTGVTNTPNTAYNINKKPVKRCIINNQLFFEKLEGITDIYSYGFSFGDVDMPYIKKICHSIGDTFNVTWHFNDFGIEEHRTTYEEKICKEGFNGKFDVFHIATD